jgi:hypothetical protein
MEGNSKLEQERKPIRSEEQKEPLHRETKEPSPHKIHENKNKKEFKYFKKPFHKNKPHFRHKQEPHHDETQKKESPHPEKSHLGSLDINHQGSLDIKQASKTAKEKLAEALDKKANTVVSVSKEGENWEAIIEIIDEEYLPGKNLESMNDIIGVYDVKMSDKGELLSWNKKSSRRRGNTVG